MSLKREREWREGSANSTQEASARFVYRHTLTFKGKESAFSFPELIQLCGSFSPVLGCVDKELVLFSCSDKEARLYLGTTSTSSSVNRSSGRSSEPSLDLAMLKQYRKPLG